MIIWRKVPLVDPELCTTKIDHKLTFQRTESSPSLKFGLILIERLRENLADFAEKLSKTLVNLRARRAIAVKVVRKRLPVSPFSGLLKGCKGHKTHRFENGGTNQTPKNLRLRW